MFDSLLVSHTPGTPSTRAVIAAFLLHALVIVAAVSGTASPHGGARPTPRDTIRLEMIEAQPSAPNNPESPLTPHEPLIPAPPQVPKIPLNAPEFQPPSLSFQSLAPAEGTRTSLHRHLAESPASLDTSHPIPGSHEMNELPELVTEFHPRYPEALRRAGVTGSVQLEYVVGTDGRVEKRSVRVLARSHPGFVLAVMHALGDARFKPARRGGRAAAVLVRQTIWFRSR